MKNALSKIAIIACIFSLAACAKIKEKIQRDVNVAPPAVTFVTPVIPDTVNEIPMGSFAANANIDALIKEQTNQEFGINDMRNIRITSFKLEFTDTNGTNNMANFEFLNARLVADGQPELILVSRDNASELKATSIEIPVVSINTDLRAYLTGTNVTCTVYGTLRHPTTKTLTTKVTPQYTATVTK